MLRRDALTEYSRGSLWLLPMITAVVAVGLGALLSHVEVGPDSPLAFQGTADDARALLIGISSTMVTVIALLLGLAVVALQLSSTQFSPRLLRNFVRDRPNQIVLSVFVGTFTFSAAGLFTVGVASGERITEFPRLAVSVAVALMFVSLGLLIFFADHLAHSIQVDHIMRVVERSTLPVIRAAPPAAELPAVPPTAVPVPARESGYVQVVHLEQLLAAARARRACVRICPRIGDHVVAGMPMAWVWSEGDGRPPPTAAEFADVVGAAVRVGFERTLEQDPGLGLRQLVDPACKALSPAVNDPYTAIQAIDHLTVLFAALAARPVGGIVLRDRTGTTVVALPGRSFADHLALGVGLIRRYGAAEPTVARALLRLLTNVLRATGEDPVRWATIEGEGRLVVAAAEMGTKEPADLAPVREEAEKLREALTARRAGRQERRPAAADRVPTAPPPS